MTQIRRITVLLALIVAVGVSAKDTRKELLITPKFVPQESVESTSPTLPPELLDRGVEIRVEDGRRLPDPATIGEGTNDDDETFPIRAGAELIPYLDATLENVAQAWALKTGNERVLTITLSRYFVKESNKPVGSMYSSEVKLAYVLANAAGTTLAKGVASGEANRYGRARSADNCNEVLSDALKQAFAEVLSDGALQSAWISGKASASAAASAPAAAPKESPEERLKKLESLYKKGLITKEEYERKRAEILKEL